MFTLSPTARLEYFVELGNSLPRAVIHNAESHERRMTTAMDAFNALNPGDAFEGRLAVQIVLCSAHAADCLRESNDHRGDFAKAMRCRAQAASMMREARAARRILAQQQKTRLAVAGVAAGAPEKSATAAAPAQPAERQATPPSVQGAAPQSAGASPPAAPVPARSAAPRMPAAGVTPTIKSALRDSVFPIHPTVADTLLRGTGAAPVAGNKAGVTLDEAA